MASGPEAYVDPWQEYKAICAKLKRRFLRRPNVAEATREFAQLANRLKDDDCPHYAGLCHLAIARCEHQNGNPSGESSALKRAARFFIEAEEDRKKLGLPGFQQNLTSAIHCYGHAIKTHVEQKQVLLAACLSLELGRHLYFLEKPFEAVEHFERAAKYFEIEPINKMQSLGWLGLCLFDIGKFTESLNSVDELWNVALKMPRLEDSESDSVTETLRNCEIASLLLILELRALPQHLNERQTNLVGMYTWVADPGETLPPPGSLVKDEEDFLLLQSFVMAVQWKDGHSADKCFSELIPRLKSGFLVGLGLDLVSKLYHGDFDD